MEYISAEEFLKQDKEIQKMFIDWWQPRLGDIYRDLTPRTDDKFNLIHVCEDEFDRKDTELTKENFGGIIPLFTEGQLRKFIEDKTGCENIEILSDIEAEEYYCDLYKTLNSGVNYDSFSHLGTDKFQAYWKVALEIAKRSLIKR